LNHATERSLEGALAELKALRLAYGAAQRRCTASLQRLHARNQVLEEEVLQLRAQLVFGGIAAPAGEKTFAPVEDRLKVYGL